MDVECCGVRGEGVEKEIDIQSLHQGVTYISELAPIQRLIILVTLMTEYSEEDRLTHVLSKCAQAYTGRWQPSGIWCCWCTCWEVIQ